MIELIDRYADLPLGTADAGAVSDVATLDHRDFRVVRPRHTDAFELLP